MGRYAFFNTGLEYKFGFGIQNSEDIFRFGGCGNIHGRYNNDNPYHEWDASDKEYIKQNLEELEAMLNLLPCPFERFEKTLNGTYDLRYSLDSDHDNRTLFYQYILGCLIYHQLLYTPNLRATYEL